MSDLDVSAFGTSRRVASGMPEFPNCGMGAGTILNRHHVGQLGEAASVDTNRIASLAQPNAQGETVMISLPTLPCDNPFSRPSTLAYGIDEYASIGQDHIGEAVIASLQHDLWVIRQVNDNLSPATFANTVAPLEHSMAIIQRVWRVMQIRNRFYASPEILSLYQTLEPQYRAHMTRRLADNELSDRLREILLVDDASRRDGDQDCLQGEQRYLVEQLLVGRRFLDETLSLDESKHLAQLHAREANLLAQFSRNLTQATKASTIWVDTKAELAGLSEARIHNMQIAAQKNKSGRFAVNNDGYVYNLIGNTVIRELSLLQNRDLRERVFRAQYERARTENNRIASDLAAVRAEIAAAHNEQSYIHMVIGRESARTPEHAKELLDAVLPAAKEAAFREIEEVWAFARGEGVVDPQAWDLAYYTEKLRNHKRTTDAGVLLEHLELNNLIERGMFFMATKYYGVTFLKRTDINQVHPDVTAWEVFDGDVGEPDSGMALLLIDPYARPFKIPNSVEFSIDTKVTTLGTRPVVLLSASLPKPVEGRPCLLNRQEAQNCFRGMGRALHNAFAASDYQSGRVTELPVDIRNFSAALHGMLMYDPEIIESFALHHATGAKLTQEVISSVSSHDQFGDATERLRVLAHAYLDFAWHSIPAGEPAPSAAQMERQVLREIDLESIAPYLASHLFEHGFSMHMAARYHSYVWCEAQANTSLQRFTEQGLTRREFGNSLRAAILSRGNTGCPEEMYQRLVSGDFGDSS